MFTPAGKDLLDKLREHESKELYSLKQEMVFQERQLAQLKELLELKEIKDKIRAPAESKIM